MERSGLSIEMKVVLLVLLSLGVQDLLLVLMYISGVTPTIMQIVLAAVLVVALVAAAVWGNSLSRAVRRLMRACYVARKGDTGVLSELTRTDEIGQLNCEINRLVVLLRTCWGTESQLTRSRDVIEELERVAPEIMRSSHELLISLKELREGASAEAAILRKVAGRLGEAGSLVSEVSREPLGDAAPAETASRLRSLPALAREAELLSDEVVDEIARPTVDEASLARAVNGLRDAVRTMAQVASQAEGALTRRQADAERARDASELISSAVTDKADGSRVAELMEQSAATGLAEATRLAATFRKLGIALEAYAAGRRAE